jgi:hypothetical protein
MERGQEAAMRPKGLGQIGRSLALGMLAGLALVNAGCLAVAAGAAAAGGLAGYAYYQGSDSRDYAAPFHQTWTAAQAALGDLAMPIEGVQQGASDGALLTRTADGTRVKLSFEENPGPTTTVNVRVGVFGDHPLGERILDDIQAHLGPASVPCPAAAPIVPPETAPPPLAGASAK